jgi:hypothetical protein
VVTQRHMLRTSSDVDPQRVQSLSWMLGHNTHNLMVALCSELFYQGQWMHELPTRSTHQQGCFTQSQSSLSDQPHTVAVWSITLLVSEAIA